MSPEPPSLAQRLKGLVPVVPTPLNADESLDEAGIERLAAFVLDYALTPIAAPSSTSI